MTPRSVLRRRLCKLRRRRPTTLAAAPKVDAPRGVAAVASLCFSLCQCVGRSGLRRGDHAVQQQYYSGRSRREQRAPRRASSRAPHAAPWSWPGARARRSWIRRTRTEQGGHPRTNQPAGLRACISRASTACITPTDVTPAMCCSVPRRSAGDARARVQTPRSRGPLLACSLSGPGGSATCSKTLSTTSGSLCAAALVAAAPASRGGRKHECATRTSRRYAPVRHVSRPPQRTLPPSRIPGVASRDAAASRRAATGLKRRRRHPQG